MSAWGLLDHSQLHVAERHRIAWLKLARYQQG